MRRDPEAARTATATADGKRRVDAMRAEFDRFAATERSLAVARQHHSDVVAHRSVVAAAGGLAGSLALIVVFATYLSRRWRPPCWSAARLAAAGTALARPCPRGRRLHRPHSHRGSIVLVRDVRRRCCTLGRPAGWGGGACADDWTDAVGQGKATDADSQRRAGGCGAEADDQYPRVQPEQQPGQ
jgi:hypothetical protein